MKISVAMCTFNGSQYLAAQLESLASQTRLPDELVVCDDASTDDTRAIVDVFADGSPFPVRLHARHRNVGVVRNFEDAIRHCSGDVIALCDQDDIWHEDKLQRTEAAFNSNPEVGMVFSDADVVDVHLRPLGYSAWQSFGFGPRSQRMVTSGQAFRVFLRDNVVTGATMAFRRSFRDLILPVPIGKKWLHDGWIALLVAAVAEVAFIDDPLIWYRQHNGQQVGASSPSGMRTTLLELVRPSHRLQNTRFLDEVEQYQEAYKRLSVWRTSCRGQPDAPELVAAKIRHLEARGWMPDSRLKRLPTVLRELATSRYHLFSCGIRSAARDAWY